MYYVLQAQILTVFFLKIIITSQGSPVHERITLLLFSSYTLIRSLLLTANMTTKEAQTESREPPNGGARAWMVTVGAFAAQMSVLPLKNVAIN